MALSFHQFESKISLIQALKTHISNTLNESLKAQNKPFLALSGGTTPSPLYVELAKENLRWSDIKVTLTDERLVPTDNAESNEKMIKETLIQDKAAECQFIPLMHDDVSDEALIAQTQASLDEINSRFDLVLLGMGNDMHTASLFPDAPELLQALRAENNEKCLLLNPASASGKRISLTLPTLLNSQAIILLINGQAKWDALQLALSYNDPIKAPVSAILNQDTVPVHVYWAP